MYPVSARRIRQIAALLTFVTALVILFAPSHLSTQPTYPLTHFSELADSFLTAAIFYASIGLLKGRRGGWYAAVAILSLATVWEAILARHALVPYFALLPLAVLIFILLYYKDFRKKSKRSGQRLLTVFLITISMTLAGCLVYVLIALHGHRHFSLIAALIMPLSHMYSLNTSLLSIISSRPHESVVAYILLFIIGVFNYALIALALLQPVLEDYFHPGRRTIARILGRYGRDSEDFFKLWPRDKRYFTAPGIDGFIAYARSENTCMILADPIASDTEHQARLLRKFLAWCIENDQHAAAVPVRETSRALYEMTDFSLLKIGENALVDISQFCADTIRNKHFRNIINRFEKSGYSIEWISKPTDPQLIAELKTVSDQWLARGHDERSFAMGYFSPTYLRQCDLVCVRSADNQLLGFINLLPRFARQRASFDMMRTADDAPKNTIDFLLAKTIVELEARGFLSLDFGLAPLTGLKTSDSNIEKVLDFIATRGSRWYSFHGLRQFKQKFEPEWQPTYLAYQGSTIRLMSYIVALLAVMEHPSESLGDIDL